MFFYKIVRTSGANRLEKYLYSQDRFLVIPIIDPTSPAGIAMLNDEYLLLIADAAEKANADIIYIRKDDEEGYRNFISDFRKMSDTVAEIKLLRDPMIVIKTPELWEMFIISNISDESPGEIKNILWGIINCISAKNASKKIKKYIASRKFSAFYSCNGEIINSILTVMQIAITAATGCSGPK